MLRISRSGPMVLALAAVAIIAAACGQGGSDTAGNVAPSTGSEASPGSQIVPSLDELQSGLSELRSIQELRDLFNSDDGVTRVVLLLSPT